VRASYFTTETAMKTLITATAAATLLLAAPFALAHDWDDRRGHWGYPWKPPGWKHGHFKHGHPRAPAVVERHIYYAPPVVHGPVYVPVPAPVVVHPPYPYPRPANSVDIGFRIFF
jgi:hypothetical protein